MARWPYPFQNVSNADLIPPGLLRYQVQVQSKSSASQSPSGSPVATWATVLTCMGAVLALTPKEAFQDGQYISQVVSRISIYWPGASIVITGGMQVLLSQAGLPNRTLTIQNPVLSPRGRVVDLFCIEINGGQ